MKSLLCPISSERVEENTVRITGFFILIILVASILLRLEFLLGIVMFDYFIRAFTTLPHSPLSWFSQKILHRFHWHAKKIDKAPKIFAARVGFLFVVTGSILTLISPMVGYMLLVVLGAFACLESMGNLCMGCLVYTHVILRIYKNHH